MFHIVEAVPNILTKDTGIVLELLEFPKRHRCEQSWGNHPAHRGRWSWPGIRTIKHGVFREVCHHARKRRSFDSFWLTASCYFETFAPAVLWGGRWRKQMFIRWLPFLPSSEALSEVSLSSTDMKIKLMDLAAPAAHRDRGDTQQSGRGRRVKEALRPLHVPSDLSHHSVQTTLTPSLQYCSLPLDSQLPDCAADHLYKSTPQMRPLPWLCLFKVLLGRAVWIVWSALKYGQHDLEWLDQCFSPYQSTFPILQSWYSHSLIESPDSLLELGLSIYTISFVWKALRLLLSLLTPLHAPFKE